MDGYHTQAIVILIRRVIGIRNIISLVHHISSWMLISIGVTFANDIIAYIIVVNTEEIEIEMRDAV